MPNRTFPRWSGPLVGTIAGTLLGVRQVTRGEDTFDDWAMVLACAGVGLLAGVVIAIFDRPTPPARQSDETDQCTATPTRSEKASALSRILAFASLLLCWMPMIGLSISIVALIMNKQHGGSALTVSKIGFWCSLIITIALMFLFLTGPL